MYDDGHLLMCYEELFDTFEAIRTAWGKPLVVTSGYRCAKHNAEVGGEPMSPHRFGLAMDLKVDSFEEARKLAECAKGTGRAMRMGYKKYSVPTFHFDVALYVWPRPSEYFVEAVEW
jgi:hypothetical protein